MVRSRFAGLTPIERSAQENWDTQSPADQNWYVSRGFGPPGSGATGDINPNESQWAGYNRVLNFRGAQLNPRANPAEPGLPAGYTQDQLDLENAEALTGGAAPRWAGSQNLPGSQQRISASMRGLQDLLRGRR